MKTTSIALLLFSASAVWGQPSQAPIASLPIVTVEGRIQKVEIAQQQGMPSLELRSAEKSIKVFLGPMRFLIQNDFNPKTGQQAKVKGFHVDPDVMAIEVEIPAEKKTLRFRDENGRPLWRGGPMRDPPAK